MGEWAGRPGSKLQKECRLCGVAGAAALNAHPPTCPAPAARGGQPRAAAAPGRPRSRPPAAGPAGSAAPAPPRRPPRCTTPAAPAPAVVVEEEGAWRRHSPLCRAAELLPSTQERRPISTHRPPSLCTHLRSGGTRLCHHARQLAALLGPRAARGGLQVQGQPRQRLVGGRQQAGGRCGRALLRSVVPARGAGPRWGCGLPGARGQQHPQRHH